MNHRSVTSHSMKNHRFLQTALTGRGVRAYASDSILSSEATNSLSYLNPSSLSLSTPSYRL